jgi:RNA polymerase subunit RPABC4/transcription elongation factor Spt4
MSRFCSSCNFMDVGVDDEPCRGCLESGTNKNWRVVVVKSSGH